MFFNSYFTGITFKKHLDLSNSFKNKQADMRTIISSAVIIFALITCMSCKRKGCTDPYASNFEAKAKNDDGSCIDPREQYVGTYQMIDSIFVNGEFSLRKFYNMSVTTKGHKGDSLFFINIWNNGADMYGKLADGSFTITEQQGIIGFHVSINGSFSSIDVKFTTYLSNTIIRGSGLKE